MLRYQTCIMGKKKNNHRPPKKKDPPSVRRTVRGDSLVATAESTAARSSLIHHSKSSASLPLPFPPGLPLPKDAFLCNTEPYKKSFQAAIDTCYEGFAVDLQINDVTEAQVQTALLDLERKGFFRTDVTQPFGLGTKCAKTYVTRCLLGDEGTTYKYLGLRMFSTPWNLPSTEKKPEKSLGVQTIQHLNQALTRRTENHLARLAQKRCQRRGHEETTRGRAGFDICLVNRMTHSAELKEEPSMKRGKCAVSWHADSSLEHFSTIAVYHTIMSNDSNNTSDNLANDWSVALRVAHHCEGPEASRRGTNIQSTLVTEAPSLSVSLPSGSTYYLLDDFNHHHQHAVVSQPHGRSSETTNRSVRYSCTHRLLRESHNVMYILERCQKACSMFHKKGSKLWRSEQLLLNEIESEWIRQFYVQGQQHYDLLWKVSNSVVCTLWFVDSFFRDLTGGLFVRLLALGRFYSTFAKVLEPVGISDRTDHSSLAIRSRSKLCNRRWRRPTAYKERTKIARQTKKSIGHCRGSSLARFNREK